MIKMLMQATTMIMVVALWMITACTHHSTAVTNLPIDTLAKYKVKEIKLEQGSSTMGVRVNLLPANGLLAIYIPNKNKLSIFDLNLSKEWKSIDFSKYFVDKKVDFWMDGDTNLYANEFMTNTIYKFDKNGGLINKQDLDLLEKRGNYNQTLYTTISPLMFNQQHDMAIFLLPYVDMRTEEGRRLSFSSKPLKIFHHQNDSFMLSKDFAGFPEEYLRVNHNESDFCFYPVSDSVVAYVFNTGLTIFTKNIYTDKVVSNKINGLLENNTKPYSYDSSSNGALSYASAYDISNDAYNGFLFDGLKKSYFLFQSKGIPVQDSIGNLNEYDDKPVFLYVINAADRRVQKVFYCGQEGDYWFFKPMIYKNRLILFKKSYNEGSTAKITLDCYEI